VRHYSTNSRAEKVFRFASTAAAVLASFTVALIIFFMCMPALKALSQVPLSAFFSTTWNPRGYSGSSWGILPFIAGSLWTTVIALVISVPLSFLAAVFSSQFMSKALRSATDVFFSLLAHPPDILAGLPEAGGIAVIILEAFGMAG